MEGLGRYPDLLLKIIGLAHLEFAIAIEQVFRKIRLRNNMCFPKPRVCCCLHGQHSEFIMGHQAYIKWYSNCAKCEFERIYIEASGIAQSYKWPW